MTPPAGPPSEPLDLAARSILVVDDESTVRALVGRILEGAGMTVLDAAHGRAALEILETGRPGVDLVLSDVLMPELSGPALARLAAERWPTLPFLFMSGFPGDAIVGEGLLTPEAALIRKPFTPGALLSAVRTLLAA